MKIKITLAFILAMVLQSARSQVWYPEGVYLHAAPTLIKVDNQVITISKVGPDLANSLWQVSINNGKIWDRLPILELSKGAEITDIIRFEGSIYVSGNFTFNNANANALVKFNPMVGKWEGVAKFQKAAQPASITTLAVQNKQLILGGNFINIVVNLKSDTISYLAAYSGNLFSHFFTGCKHCDPNAPVIDIATFGDTVTAISGSFTSIGNHKSLYLVRLVKNIVKDTFNNTPKLMEKLAIDGHTIYATAGLLKDKRIFMVTKTFTDINYNLDSSLFINEILVHEGKLVANGAFSLAGSTSRTAIVKFDGLKWVDISNNYRNATYIATGRSALFAIGNPAGQISVWNPNRNVVRFYPNLSLIKVNVFLDSNNNCIREKNEKPIPKQFIRLFNRGAFANENGLAEFLVPHNIVQEFSIKLPRNFKRSNCSDTSRKQAYLSGTYYDSIQFSIVRIPNINDIKVTLSSPKGAQVQKNKRVMYNLKYENVGSTVLVGKVRLKKNTKFQDIITEPKFDQKIGDSIYEWNFNGLQPGENRMVTYVGSADDTSFKTDQQFSAMASSSISSGSAQYTSDDFDSIPQVVDGTANAFRKDVYPMPNTGDSITYLSTADRDLRYHISFNNFTSDTVYYAVVIDTLDLNLDMSYVQETGSNKFYYTEVQVDPNNQYKAILIWHFPNIKLTPNPAMNFEQLSCGSYIGFKVVTEPLSKGYILKNVASVFYDNEYAGTTNPVYCSLQITDIDEFDLNSEKLGVFPNPFNHEFNLAWDFKAGDRISLYNTSGQLVYQSEVSEDTDRQSIDASGLTGGIYVIQLYSEGRLITRKCLKL